jgi:hypothetical protein
MNDPIDVRYLYRLTDDTGMFQHAVLGVPDPSEGYTTDDNARALVLASMLYERSGEHQYEELMSCYLSFLLYAEKGRWFRNFMGFDRKFTEKRGSEDCFGRCLFALGYVVSRTAYASIGLSLWRSENAKPYLELLQDSLADTYIQCRRENWRWFEDKITYCSAVLPLAVFSSCETDDPKQQIGFESLDFLSEAVFRDGMFVPVGCKGWMKCEEKPAVYDEQPVEACSMILACLKAYSLTKNEVYRDRAKQCFFWYLGRNIGNTSLIDPETGGCRDGLTRRGLNGNEGAESLVCWLTAALLAEQNGWYPPASAAGNAKILWL